MTYVCYVCVYIYIYLYLYYRYLAYTIIDSAPMELCSKPLFPNVSRSILKRINNPNPSLHNWDSMKILAGVFTPAWKHPKFHQISHFYPLSSQGFGGAPKVYTSAKYTSKTSLPTVLELVHNLDKRHWRSSLSSRAYSNGKFPIFSSKTTTNKSPPKKKRPMDFWLEFPRFNGIFSQPQKNIGVSHRSQSHGNCRWSAPQLLSFASALPSCFFKCCELVWFASLLLPRSLTWKLKMMVSKRNLFFQGLIFRFHVKLQGDGGNQPLQSHFGNICLEKSKQKHRKQWHR